MSKNENCAICRDLGDMCESCKIVHEKYQFMASDLCAKINTSDPEPTHQGEPVAWMVRREDGSLEGIHTTLRDMTMASFYRMTVTPLYERAGSFEVAQLQKLCDARLKINLMFRAQVAEREALLRKIIDARSENDMPKAVDEAEAFLRTTQRSMEETGRSDLVHRGPSAALTTSLVHYGPAALAMPASAELGAIPDFTQGNGNQAERRATAVLAKLQADLTARDQRLDQFQQVLLKLHQNLTGTLEQHGLREEVEALLLPDLESRPEERGTPETEPCSGCGTPGWTGACNKCVPY